MIKSETRKDYLGTVKIRFCFNNSAELQMLSARETIKDERQSNRHSAISTLQLHIRFMLLKISRDEINENSVGRLHIQVYSLSDGVVATFVKRSWHNNAHASVQKKMDETVMEGSQIQR